MADGELCVTCSRPSGQTENSCNCPPDIKGKYRNRQLIDDKADELVRCGLENGWDRESILEWVRVSWFNQTR